MLLHLTSQLGSYNPIPNGMLNVPCKNDTSAGTTLHQSHDD